jgi:hypothetical protein
MKMWKQTIKKYFPGANLGSGVTSKVIENLESQGFNADNTIFGNSTCPDEVNRKVTAFGMYYGENFPMGGLAGYPFSGFTGEGAFAHHAPDRSKVQHIFVTYGPHLGISEKGELGKVKRRGMNHQTTACGSAIAAYDQIKQAWEKEEIAIPEFNPHDQQQYWIQMILAKHTPKLIHSEQPMCSVVEILYQEIDKEMMALWRHESKSFTGLVALLGGIQINTPIGQEDYFLPKRFGIYNTETGEFQNLLTEITWR